MNNHLSIHSLSKKYKNSSNFANKNITIVFSPGEIVAVTGHNGAGKTTFLNQIIGVTKPTSGSITFQGHSLDKNWKMARQFAAMMPQFHAPLDGVTMQQSIEAILRIRGFNKSDIQTHVIEIMQELKISKWSHVQGQKLSGGLQRLTSFAMSIVAPPPILLLDEPTNDVDPIRRKIIWNSLRKLAQKGHIVIVVTHNLLEVDQYADRYLLFDKGTLIKDAYVRKSLEKTLIQMHLVLFSEKEFEMQELPRNIGCILQKGELRYDITLSQEQVVDAMIWINEKISSREVTNYSLSPQTLENTYGGLTNEK
ncbi:TPA: ABC transporter ATP-binding protein [Enterococcus faecium]|nr:ABC transporter ATP-binding protein [Enterococcus faecium]HEG4566432.1 ABC transporter ATP-binding protein [Enterococcus faecium]HEG4568975.1 ABC transporter ATP-binding protein [Enterococcus faecium]